MRHLKRVLSSIALASILFGALWGGAFTIKILILVSTLALQYEFNKMIYRQSSYPWSSFYLVLSWGLTLIATQIDLLSILFLGWIIGVLIHIWIFSRIPVSNDKHFPPAEELTLSLGVFSILTIYSIALPMSVYLIVDFNNGPLWFLFLLCSTLFNDITAYFTGVYLGKTPLLPSLSPKKTVEGLLGGLAGSALSGGLMSYYLPQVNVFILIALALLLGLLGQTGDLLESLFKRWVGVKDSGFLIPGHGGILDRIDGVLLAAPLLLIFLKYFF